MPSAAVSVSMFIAMVPAAANPSNTSSDAARQARPQWIWFPESVTEAQNQRRYFRRSWSLPWRSEKAVLQITVDDEFELRINGRKVATGTTWRDYKTCDVTRHLRKGPNSLRIQARNHGGHAGVILVAEATGPSGQIVRLVTDERWQASRDGRTWQPARVVATYPGPPWGRLPVPSDAHEHDTSRVVPDAGLRILSAMAGFMGGGIPRADALPNVDPARVPLYRELGLRAVAEYAYWWYLEPEPGQWDWRFSDRVHEGLGKLGLGHAVYPWFHVAPPWYQKTDRYTPLRCLQHDKDIDLCMSLWDPNAPACCERLYAAYRSHFGDEVGPIFVGIYGDFGEVMFPVAINPWWRPKCKHNHIDFWTADRFARRDFVRFCRAKYGRIETLNQRWGSALARFEDITYPKDEKTPRWWLDFIEWRYESMNRFTAAALRAVRKHYPKTELHILLGGGSELLYYAQDNTGLPKLCAEYDVVVHSTHGGGREMWFMAKRIATAAKFYGLRYVTEPPGKVPPERVLERLFIDASTGVTGMFEYMHNLFENAPQLSRYLGLLRQDPPLCEAAALFCTTYHRLQPAARRPGPGAVPQKLKRAFDEIHDVMDLDLLDEPLIADGALDRYKLLIQFEGDIYEARTIERIVAWVRQGGVLILCGQRPWRTPEGLCPAPADFFEPTRPLPGLDGAVIKRFGKGSVIGLRSESGGRPAMYEAIYAVASNLSRYSQTCNDLFVADGRMDGVWTTTFADRILLLNTSPDASITKTLAFRHPRTGKPTEITVTLAPREMRYVWIDGEPAQVEIVCAAQHSPAVPEAGANRPPRRRRHRMLTLEPGGSARLRAVVERPGTYAVHARIVSNPSGRRAEIRFGRNRTIRLATQANDSWRIPKVGQIQLAQGELEIILHNPNRGRIHADRLILTTDTRLAGFRYPIVRRPDVRPFGLAP